ncbi:MAG: hypothetical protein ACOZCO_10250 [Bacteroidota bacterium]
MKLENQNILIISNEPWGEIWFSKHNYAFELSKKNKVIFINPAPRWSVKNIFKRDIIIKKENGRLCSLSYKNILPHYFLKWNNRLVSSMIRKKLEKEGIHQTIFWSFDPVRLFDPRQLNSFYSLFEAVDKYRLSLKAEKYLYANVDSVIVISEDFKELYKPFGKPVLCVSHAISTEEFEPENSASVKPVTDKNSALYIGNLDHRVDYLLIKKMAEEFPQTRFVFIGGIRETNNAVFRELFIEKKYSNVVYEGKKHFKELKHHIHACGFCIAPMALFESNTISHHKIFQYLAMGKAVFSCRFSEYTSFAHLLYMEDDHALLIEKIKSFLSEGENDTLKSQRIKKAREFTFDAVLQKIELFISETLRPGQK